MLFDCDFDDERYFVRFLENWIVVFYLRERSGSFVNDLYKECIFMIDRVIYIVVYIYMYYI